MHNYGLDANCCVHMYYHYCLCFRSRTQLRDFVAARVAVIERNEKFIYIIQRPHRIDETTETEIKQLWERPRDRVRERDRQYIEQIIYRSHNNLVFFFASVRHWLLLVGGGMA